MAIKQHINVTNLAALLDVTTRTIRNWTNDPTNPLPAKKVNGVWLLEIEAVEKWLERKNTTVATDAIVDELLNIF